MLLYLLAKHVKILCLREQLVKHSFELCSRLGFGREMRSEQNLQGLARSLVLAVAEAIMKCFVYCDSNP